MEIIQKYDDEKVYAILTIWLESSLNENTDERIEEIDVFNIVVKNTSRYSIEGHCELIIYGESDEVEYETDFMISFDDQDIVEDVEFAFKEPVGSK